MQLLGARGERILSAMPSVPLVRNGHVRWSSLPWMKDYVSLRTIHNECGRLVPFKWLKQRCVELDIMLRWRGRWQTAVAREDAYRLLDSVVELCRVGEWQRMGKSKAGPRKDVFKTTGPALMNDVRRALAVRKLYARMRQSGLLAFVLRVGAENMLLRSALGDQANIAEITMAEAERRADMLGAPYARHRRTLAGSIMATAGIHPEEVMRHYEKLLAEADLTMIGMASGFENGKPDWLI